jgi:hypothetical protein
MQSFQSMRCSYGSCPWPDEATHYLQVYDGTIAGGRDWSFLTGKVICDTCYEQYKESGSLDVATSSGSGSSSSSSRASTSAKRCSYECCTSANASSQLIKIQAGTSAGGQDWTSLVGRVLCHECCNRFMAFGSLDGDPICPPCAPARRCGYEHCLSPDQSYSFHEIKDMTEAGGQDWTSLVGRVLCSSCYCRFKRHGSLEGGTGPDPKPLSAEEKRCGYEHCCKPNEGKQFYEIKADTKAGGQDWTSLVGRVLCHTCYQRYRQTGSLDRQISPPSKRQKTSA